MDNVATVSRDNAFAAMSDVVLAIAGELRLDAVLDRLVHAARELVDARYAALGIPDEDGMRRYLDWYLAEAEAAPAKVSEA